MKVLVACEYSGIVRDAFLARGHDAVSCDILPTESPGPHIQGDVTELLHEPWDMVIAFPPCTYLSNARIVWKYRMPDWDYETTIGACFFNLFKMANAPLIAIENPLPHGDALELIGRPHAVFEPWEHGHPYIKRSCLWLYGLPPLMATDIVQPEFHWVSAKGVPGGHRNPKKRAEFHPGVAAAMADQWG